MWVATLLRRYRQDYLYGNLMADSILAKNRLPSEKNTHNWGVAVRLLESAETSSEEAFSLGYVCHLAADTVAHGIYTPGRKNMEHAFFEIKSDGLIDRRYWLQALRIDRQVQYRNDAFLERSLDCVILSFKNNKRIFKGMLLLAGLNRGRFGDFIDRKLLISVKDEDIKRLHLESLDRMVDVLCYGKQSDVLKKDPIGRRSNLF